MELELRTDLGSTAGGLPAELLLVPERDAPRLAAPQGQQLLAPLPGESMLNGCVDRFAPRCLELLAFCFAHGTSHRLHPALPLLQSAAGCARTPQAAYCGASAAPTLGETARDACWMLCPASHKLRPRGCAVLCLRNCVPFSECAQLALAATKLTLTPGGSVPFRSHFNLQQVHNPKHMVRSRFPCRPVAV